MTEQARKPFLYVVVCAAGIAADVSKLISAAQERDWETGVIATPVAMNGFFDTAAVEALTGRPIRSAWRTPAEPRPFPPPDAVVVAPATFNTINKWAAGINDTLALGILNEALGSQLPILVVPYAKAALTNHPIFAQNLEFLRQAGARLTATEAIRPASDDQPFAWRIVIDELATLLRGRNTRSA